MPSLDELVRRKKALGIALVVLGCVAGGTLECTRNPKTPEQAHGSELYERMCAVCHGKSGEGYLADEAPALGHPDFLATVTDEFLTVAIANGRTDTVMSPWASSRGGPLTDDDVRAIVAHIRTWQDQPALRDPKKTTGSAVRGAAVYARECVRCHGYRGRTGPNVRIGNPELLATASDGFLRAAIRHGRPGTPMPAFAEQLGETGVEDVLAFVRTFRQPEEKVVQHPPARPPPIPLGPVPLNPKGPEPTGFQAFPKTTGADIVHKQLARGAKMALLDARAPSAYTHRHIAGAVSVPFYDPSPYLTDLPKDAWLVCYCACPHAESRTLAQRLLDAGFKKVTVLDEGLGYWQTKQYPITEGRKP